MLSVSELPSSLAWDQGLLKTQDYANFGPGLSSDRESEYQWERDSYGLNLLTLAVVISSIRMLGLEEERLIFCQVGTLQTHRMQFWVQMQYHHRGNVLCCVWLQIVHLSSLLLQGSCFSLAVRKGLTITGLNSSI